MESVKDKIILITGASAGIGFACAKLFAREGARLIICARREEKLKELAQYVEDRFDTKTLVCSIDIQNSKDIEKQLNKLPDEWKRIDILLNNAGLSRGLDKIHEGKLADWEEMIDTNIKGLLYITRLVAAGMVERGSGHIINISSISGHEVYPGGAVYCATKHAVDAITRGMQMDLVDSPVRVSSVDPGMVETEFSLVRFHGDENKASAVYRGLRPLNGYDVAEAVLFCATRPPHVNIHQLRIMPKDQASALIANRQK